MLLGAACACLRAEGKLDVDITQLERICRGQRRTGYVVALSSNTTFNMMMNVISWTSDRHTLEYRAATKENRVLPPNLSRIDVGRRAQPEHALIERHNKKPYVGLQITK